jgi:hypothetical protein
MGVLPTRSGSQGEANGRASVILEQLTYRFGELSSRTTARVQRASLKELKAMGKRLLTAPTVKKALGPSTPARKKRKRRAKKA